MFTPGPSIMSFFLNRASSPTTLPYSAASAGLKVAARQVRAGMAVQESFVQPAHFQSSQVNSILTPWGPSLIQISGMPRRGQPGVLNFDWA